MAADVKFKVGRVALSTAAAGNTQDFEITGFGATPKAAIFIISSAITDGASAADSRIAIGWCNATTQNVVSATALDAITPANNGTIHTAAACIALAGQNSNELLFSFNSFAADKVTLDIDDAAAGAYLCTFILIGGDDVTDTHVGFHDDFNATTTDITSLLFEPDLAFFTCANFGTAPAATGPYSRMGLGVWINDISQSQGGMCLHNEPGTSPSKVLSYIGNTGVLPGSFGSTLNYVASVGSPDANGFTFTLSDTDGAGLIPFWLALKFSGTPDIAVFDMEWPTSGNYAETTPAFRPGFGMLFSMAGPSTRNTADITSHAGLSIAAFDAVGIYTTTVTNKDAVTTTVTKSLSDDALKILSGDGTTTSVLASSYSLDTAGWDFTLSTNPSGNAVLGFGLAIGAVEDFLDTAAIASLSLTDDYLVEHDEIGSVSSIAALSLTSTYSDGLNSEETAIITVYNSLSLYETAPLNGTVTTVLPLVSGTMITELFSQAVVTNSLPVVAGIGTSGAITIGQVEPRIPFLTTTLASGNIGVGVIETPLSIISGTTGWVAVVQPELASVSGLGLTGRVGTGVVNNTLAQVAGVLSQQTLTIGEVVIPGPVAFGEMLQGTLNIGNVQNRPSTVAATGLSGGIGAGAVLLPLPDINATFVIEVIGIGEILLPLPDVRGTGLIILSDSITWVLNTENNRVTNYTQFPFIALGLLGVNPVGATVDGLYLLTGDNDDGQSIDSIFKFGMTDFRSEFVNNADVYVGGDIESDMEIGIREDGQEDENTYTLFERERHVRGHHAKLGKGFRSRYRQLSISNVNGGNFDLDSLSLSSRDLRGNE